VTRYLGVDYGRRRIGLAISDGAGITARPLEVVSVADLEETLTRIGSEYEIVGVVLGLPTSLGGYEGDSAEGARRLGDRIGSLLQVPVVFVDERFTSRIAEEALLESGMKRRERKETVDKVAAAIILQTYLDTRKADGNPVDDGGVEPTESP
jgi:putative Holliday junction resolvase